VVASYIETQELKARTTTIATPTTIITPLVATITTTTPTTKETQEFKAKKNLPLSTLSDKE
jgi:hypothetical protein